MSYGRQRAGSFFANEIEKTESLNFVSAGAAKKTKNANMVKLALNRPAVKPAIAKRNLNADRGADLRPPRVAMVDDCSTP
eukprot:2922999-Rhodomonas_salina.5